MGVVFEFPLVSNSLCRLVSMISLGGGEAELLASADPPFKMVWFPARDMLLMRVPVVVSRAHWSGEPVPSAP